MRKVASNLPWKHCGIPKKLSVWSFYEHDYMPIRTNIQNKEKMEVKCNRETWYLKILIENMIWIYIFTHLL